MTHNRPKIAYLSLQAVAEGQDTWAAVMEIIEGFREFGWDVDEYFPDYRSAISPPAHERLSEMWRIQRELASRIGDYDALYVRAHPLALPATRAAEKAGVPVIQECNGPCEDLFIAWPSTRIARPLFESMQRRQYQQASAIVSVAEGLTQWLIEDTGNRNVITNGNGANVGLFSPDAPRLSGLPDRFAVFFGQFPAWQGIPTLLEAVERPEWPQDLPIVFVGDGAMRPNIEESAQKHPNLVSYLGRLPYEDVAKVAAHAELSFVPMLMPEREEKFSPLKLYESMACGVAIVGSDTPGISEVVTEHDCGILFTPGDAAQVAQAAATLNADPATARRMGANARAAAVNCYSWRVRARQRLDVVERVTGVSPSAISAARSA